MGRIGRRAIVVPNRTRESSESAQYAGAPSADRYSGNMTHCLVRRPPPESRVPLPPGSRLVRLAARSRIARRRRTHAAYRDRRLLVARTSGFDATKGNPLSTVRAEVRDERLVEEIAFDRENSRSTILLSLPGRGPYSARKAYSGGTSTKPPTQGSTSFDNQARRSL